MLKLITLSSFLLQHEDRDGETHEEKEAVKWIRRHEGGKAPAKAIEARPAALGGETTSKNHRRVNKVIPKSKRVSKSKHNPVSPPSLLLQAASP